MCAGAQNGASMLWNRCEGLCRVPLISTVGTGTTATLRRRVARTLGVRGTRSATLFVPTRSWNPVTRPFDIFAVPMKLNQSR